MAGSDTLNLIYDGANLVLEVVGTARRREYTNYPGIDRPHSLTNWTGGDSGVTYYFAQDDPGHVLGLINGSKQVSKAPDAPEFLPALERLVG